MYTLQNNVFANKLDTINAVANNIKSLIPTIMKDAASEAAIILVNAAEDATVFEALDTMDLLSVKGIGEKYAEKIIENKLAVIGKLVKLGEYSVNNKPSSPLIKRNKVSFNQEWDPEKAPSLMFIKEETSVIEGELARFFEKKGWDPEKDMFVFNSFINGSEKENPNRRVQMQLAAWKKFTHEGIRIGGRNFKPLFHGPNAARKDEILFCVEEYIEEARRFATLDTWNKGKNTAAKQAGRAGLTIGGTTPLSAWLGGYEISPRNVCVVPSFKELFENIPTDFVDSETGKVELNTLKDVILNAFDGFGMMYFSKEKLAELRNSLPQDVFSKLIEALKKMPSFTIRGGETKGLIVTKVDFHEILKLLGVTEIEDKWGTKHPIDEIIMLIDESVLKLSIGKNGQFESYEDYCKAFENYGHTFQVMLMEHQDKPHNLPFQQLQSCIGANIDTIRPAIEKEIATINGFTKPENAARLLGGDLANIVRLVPEMHMQPWIKTREQQAYDKYVREAKAGTLHKTTHNVFCAPDFVAFLQWAAYRDPAKVTGFIPANTVCCKVLKEDEGVVSRNPSTDAQAQCVVNVMHDAGEYEKYIRYTTICFMSVNSLEIMRVRGDYDGDHLCVSDNKALVAAAKEANAFTGGRLIDWSDVTSDKEYLDEAKMADYFYSLTKTSQLGHFCDQLTSLVGFGPRGYNHEVACWLVMAVNVFVDASKHGMGNVAIPEFVVNFLSLKDENGEVIVDEYNRPVQRPLPIYAMQAKDNHRMSAKEKRVGGKRCAKKLGAGNGDQLRLNIELNCKNVLAVNMEGIDGNFNVADLMFDFKGEKNNGNTFGLRGCEALFASGQYNEETKEYENEGLWKKLCYSRSKHLKELVSGMSDEDVYVRDAAQKTYKTRNRALAIFALTEWAKENGKTIEDVYDAATFYTWVSMKYPIVRKNETEEKLAARIGNYTLCVEAWCDIFGGMALRAIYARNQYILTGGVIETFEDKLDDVTNDLF